MEKKKKAVGREKRPCPFCDVEISKESFPFCQACGAVVLYCPVCRKPVSKEKETCPHCGAEMKAR